MKNGCIPQQFFPKKKIQFWLWIFVHCGRQWRVNFHLFLLMCSSLCCSQSATALFPPQTYSTVYGLFANGRNDKKKKIQQPIKTHWQRERERERATWKEKRKTGHSIFLNMYFFSHANLFCIFHLKDKTCDCILISLSPPRCINVW